MKRRDALKAGAGALLAAGSLEPLAGSMANAAPPTLRRRVRPSDAAWPTAEDWSNLAKSLDGSLTDCIRPVDAVMAKNGGALNEAAQAELQNPFVIQDYSGGTQSSGWVDGWLAQTSAKVVIPRTARDVSQAVTFARDHALRLVVKGGAHSYLVQSNAPDSLLIWTRDLTGLELHDGFVPQGCAGKTAPRPAVSVGAGEKFIGLYDFTVRQHGRYVQGGGCTSVGVGGHMQTGGFGSFSKCGGMTCASLLEAEIVTADGSILTVNECQHPDLFWALKGGGAGWGITTRLTLATQELPALLGSLTASFKAKSDQAFLALVERFLGFAQSSLINPHWGEQAAFSADNSLAIHMNFQGLDAAAAQAVWQPFLDWLGAHTQDYEVTQPLKVVVAPAPHWWDFAYRKANFPATIRIDARDGKETGRFWWAGNSVEVGVFIAGYESLWLPQSLLADDRRAELAATLVKASRLVPASLHFNKGLAGATEARREEARNTAVHPSCIDAFALVIFAGGQTGTFPGIAGHGPDVEAAQADAAKIAAALALLRPLAPDGGSYSSEMGYHAPDWQGAAWGPNYQRLLQVKTTYDPKGLFTGHHQVGSEMWSPDGFERL
jgi:FAD/FMN-containing dehydrogenase